MPTAEEFDEFYVSTRRELVLQTFALTGDLVASRSAVRDAYVAARHHWEKLGRAENPMSWVRPRAWSRAQRRHTVRPWHRERHIDADQTATLEALHQLRDAQRRTLVLAHLTELPLDAIAREVALPVPRIEELFAEATAIVTEALSCTPTQILGRLRGLETAADSVKLPRPTIVRRNGLRRRRNFAIVGSAAIAALMAGAGTFVAVGATVSTGAPRVLREQDALVNQVETMLLTSAQVAGLAPKKGWTQGVTDRNLTGQGLNTSCQGRRFADENGAGTWVRKFHATSGPATELVQTVEISKNARAAKKAYATTLGWYAGCTVARVQLVDAYTVSGVGDEAQVLRLRIPGSDTASYVVGVARTGSLTASAVLETSSSTPVAANLISATLATSVKNLCGSKDAGTCVGAVSTSPSIPPSAGETPGMLATADMPAIAGVDAPWAGTKPAAAVPNRASTNCDLADFSTSGAVNPLSRSFLIPQGKLPTTFGLTETIGQFASAKAATQFVNQVIARMKSCPKRELSSTITDHLIQPGTAKSPQLAYWRLINQISQNRAEVTFWMGITRVGPYVAQVLMSPVKKYDVNATTYAQLMLRAHDRLLGLS